MLGVVLWSAGQVFEDLDDGRWVFNGSQNIEIALAVGADLYVDVKHAL